MAGRVLSHAEFEISELGRSAAQVELRVSVWRVSFPPPFGLLKA